MLTMTLLVAAADVCLCAERAENRDERFVVPAAMSGVEERFGELVAMRATAIDQALGPILAGACTRITGPAEDTYPREDNAGYDPARHTLTFRRGVLDSVGKGVRSWAKSYWPYYQSEDIRLLLR